MTKSFRRDVCSVVGALCMVVVGSASAEVVYSNTTNDLSKRFEPGYQTGSTTMSFEVGDEVLLTSTGFLTNFSFQYFWDAVDGADPTQARVRFYMNNGAPYNGYPTPSTPLYDSGWFGLGLPTPRATVSFLAGLDFPLDGLFIPVTDITWSVQFQNFGNDRVGLDLYSPATVGSSFPDYWSREGGNWVLRVGDGEIPMDFAARFEANIPEPSSLSLLLLGGMGYLVSRRNRK